MYVDDIIIICASLVAIQVLKKILHDAFKLKDLGVLQYFLGIEIARSSKDIFLSQMKYTLQIIEDAGLLASKPSSLL